MHRFSVEDCSVPEQHVNDLHSHYKKDVSHLNYVDVYRVLKLFNVNDPALQHAAKKILCAGERGAKGVEKDVQEAIDSLVRWQQMRVEDDCCE